MQNNKKIIFGAPEDFGFSNAIKNELTALGYQVIDLSKINNEFKYPSILARVYNLYRKVFFHDKSYKALIRSKTITKNLINHLNNIDGNCYSLFIRPDLFPLGIFQYLKQKSVCLVAYQWDGMNRYPTIYEYIKYFDRFYCFEPTDLKENKAILPCTNFYFTSLSQTETTKINVEAFSINSFQQDRIETSFKIKSLLKKIGISNNFIVFTKNKDELVKAKSLGFITTQKTIPYEQNSKDVLSCNLLIDIQIKTQSGLSFRIFESIGYSKKIITTNKDVYKYDFYNPNNILIWDNQSESELLEFYNKEYEPLPILIKEKYSFGNWIKYVLNIEDHIPINLP